MRFWADKRRLGPLPRLRCVRTAARAANAWEWDYEDLHHRSISFTLQERSA